MRRISRAMLGVLAGLAALVAIQAAAEGPAASEFANRLLIRLQPGSGLQRLPLPAAAYGAMRSGAFSDLRVFNADGVAVPLAIVSRQDGPAERRSVALPAYAIRGPAGRALGDGVSIRIEDSDGRRTVQVENGGAGPAPDDPVVGFLVDARAQREPVDEIAIDGDLPAGQFVHVTLAASRDLKSWRTLLDGAPLFRMAGPDAPAQTSVKLGAPATLEGEYLRLTWVGTTPALRGVRMQIAPAAAAPAPVRVQLPTPRSQDATQIEWAVPFATPVASLEVKLPQQNSLVPVRILGRAAAGEAWRQVSTGVAYRLSRLGGEAIGPAFAVNGAPVRELRLVADTAAGRFDGAPQMTATFVPVDVVFLASGQPPFTLAFGRDNTAAVALPLRTLIPDYRDGAERGLPEAAVAAGAVVVGPPAAPGMPARTLILWGILVGGVAVLAAIAWSVMRQMKAGRRH